MSNADNDYITFMRLGTAMFRDNVLPGTLATAIEQFGIYTWDRFGRLRHYPLDTPEAQKALDYVAMVFESWSRPPEEQFEYMDFEEWGGDAYGWPESKCPDFKALDASIQQRHTHAPQAKPSVKGENANAGMVLALLRFIKGELDNEAHSDYQSEAQLAAFLESKMIGYPGVSVDNFKKKFAEAKKLIPKTEL